MRSSMQIGLGNIIYNMHRLLVSMRSKSSCKNSNLRFFAAAISVGLRVIMMVEKGTTVVILISPHMASSLE